MSKKQYTIVYVFGPLECAQKYEVDQLLSREYGEWVKIGETELSVNLDDFPSDELIMEKAMKRIHNEIRTGIPVICKIYDVFIFPHHVKFDDRVRKRLCSELFVLENSKENNKQMAEDKFLIRAGVEFVYGVTRSKILYAVQSVDHELLAKEKDPEKIHELVLMCSFNQKELDDNSKESNTAGSGQKKANLILDYILEVGDEVVLVKDGKDDSNNIVVDEGGKAITAKYIGGNRFECRGEEGRSSYLAKKYLEQYGGKKLTAVNGNEYWTFNGKKLTSLRKNE